MLADINRGKFVEPSSLTVAEYFRLWLKNTAALRVQGRTLQGYTTNVERHIIPALGAVKLTDLRPSHLRELYTNMVATGLKPPTVNRVHVVLHSALGQAFIDGDVVGNVADAVKPPKELKKEVKPLTTDEANLLLKQAAVLGKPRPRFGMWLTTIYDLVFLALHTGMRRGELLALRWQEVDLDGGEIVVKRTMNKTKEGIEIKPPKGRESRDIPLDIEAVAHLQALRAHNPHELVFCYEDGKPLDPSTVSHIFTRLAQRNGIPEAHFHTQRHSYATIALDVGVPIETVQELLGHKDISTTRIYAHVREERKREAAHKIGAGLANAGKQQLSSKSPEKEETQS
jgi:integrase